MCGIVGYVGKNQAVEPVIEGLRRLGYRGYDSAGIALALDSSSEKLWIEKKAGKLANLESSLPANLPNSHCEIGRAHV